ncbi:hypothetical protein [Erythrobacter ani]|uniref:Helix-turn-helix domain-containing protein n=1 Tax=Erythrobacter ani TaxID=2827235 RepID=A0ABS6SPC0_9SPHN|nr:hypothetical protein [Erythrobacter ani]MBV7266881.1 hypothetical protein [Erythrobacter ani]
MTRKTDPRTRRLPVPSGQIPDFTVVPRQGNRHDGWTPERQRAFIEALADTGSIHAACRTVDMSQRGAYHLRRQPGAESFRAAWEAALDLGVQRIEDVAMDRALNGVEEPLYSYGKLIGTRRRYNDRLLMFMLRNRAPERFAEGKAKGLNAVGRMDEDRLRKKLFAEWEAEREAALPSPEEIRAGIDRKVEGLRIEIEHRRQREWDALSEETREAWQHYEALKTRDMERLAAEEDARRKALSGPRETINAVPPPEKVVEPKVRKTVWSLKDDTLR